MKPRVTTLLTCLTLTFASQYALAKGPSGRQGPPPEAISACEGKSAGDSAQFEGRNGESVTGNCEEMDGQLILRPDSPPSRD